MSWRRTVAGHCNWKSLEITTNQHVLFSLEIPMGSRGPWCLKYIPTHSKAPKPQSVQSWQMRKCKWEIVMEVLEGVPGFLKHQNSDHFGRIRQITHLFCPTAWLASVISGVSFPKMQSEKPSPTLLPSPTSKGSWQVIALQNHWLISPVYESMRCNLNGLAF